jgi:hypothetical protein
MTTPLARPTPTGPRTPVAGSADWLRLARLARILSWLTLAWMGIEGGVAIAAAVIAGSVALLGFGLDSGIEAMASIIVIWRFTGIWLASPTSERRAQQLVAVSFSCSPPTSPSKRPGRCWLVTVPRPALWAWCSPRAPLSLSLRSGWPSGGSVPGSVPRPPPGREHRICCAPTWRSRSSPGWPPIPCGVPGGSTAWSRWGSLAGLRWKGEGRGPGDHATAHASRGRRADAQGPNADLPACKATYPRVLASLTWPGSRP